MENKTATKLQMPRRIYKLTRADGSAKFGGVVYKQGVEVQAARGSFSYPIDHRYLCSGHFIHAYPHPVVAYYKDVLDGQYFFALQAPKAVVDLSDVTLWECSWRGYHSLQCAGAEFMGLKKLGVQFVTPLRQIPINFPTLELKFKALEKYMEKYAPKDYYIAPYYNLMYTREAAVESMKDTLKLYTDIAKHRIIARYFASLVVTKEFNFSEFLKIYRSVTRVRAKKQEV